jgi:SAM-dependent methyltransferase
MRDAEPVAIPCPLCGEEDVRPWHRVTRWTTPFDVARCAACGLLHVNPRLPLDRIHDYYDAGYYGGTSDWHYADERRQEEQVRVRAAGRLAGVEARLAADGIATRRVVELGSAFGVFLDEARRRGWETRGCEISDASAAHAEESLGLEIHRCDLADAGLPDGSADLVTGSEVVEHLSEPLRTLEAAYRVLAPGGMVLFSTANEKSVARVLRGGSWGYLMPGHLVLWSAGTLRAALRRSGFRDIRVTAGDERGLANFREFRRAAGGGSLPAWLLRRVRVGDWTLGAGMVVTARKAEGAP